MIIEATVQGIGQVNTGVNQNTGIEWKNIEYVFGFDEGNTFNTFVGKVWDGQMNRIERLNLQLGKKYRLQLYMDAKSNQNGRKYNDIRIHDARLIEESQEQEGAIE